MVYAHCNFISIAIIMIYLQKKNQYVFRGNDVIDHTL